MTGLSVASDISLPGLPLLGEPSRPPDVRIIGDPDIDSAEQAWASQMARRRVEGGRLWFRPEPRLLFSVSGGREVRMYRQPTFADAHVGAYLIGLIWGALCHQRELLPLHCSAILHEGRAFAFTGPSGAGKSTLAAGLERRHFTVCSDDLLAIDPAGSTPTIYTAPLGLRLCEDAVERFAVSGHSPSRPKNGAMKYHVPLATTTMPETVDLAALFILGEEDGPPRIEPLVGEARWRELFSSVYGVRMLSWLRPRSAVATALAGVADRVPVYRFVRPRDVTRFDAGLDAIAAALAGADIPARPSLRASAS